MISTLAHLIDTQARNAFPNYQRLPYWMGEFVGFDRLDRWFRETWGWGKSNARRSHSNRPWSDYRAVLSRLYPDEIPF